MTDNATIWVLLDDRAGNVGQCLGVAESLGMPFVEKHIRYNCFARLPNQMIGASLFGLDKNSKEQIKGPWPDLVIAAGRRTAPVARYIKKQSAGKTRLVQLMDPGKSGADDFDMIFIPAHDTKPLGKNAFEMKGAPHRVTDAKLVDAQEQWRDRLKEFNHPRIGLIVGGATKNRTFTDEMARDLGQTLNRLAKAQNASVLATTSRRTGEAASSLLDQITVPALKYKWGDEGENPYFAILSSSDILIVTGDSVSMCSECCATGKPVYIYAPEGMISPKHKRMVYALVKGGYAFDYTGTIDLSAQTKKLNCAGDIAAKIKAQLL